MKILRYLGLGIVALSLISFILVIFLLMGVINIFMRPTQSASVISGKTVVVLPLEGIIMDGKKFLEKLRKYRKNDRVRAFVVQINSPGGVVGPSQEIYQEIKRTREFFKKPVVISCNGVAASGAYYAALGADRIFANPGTLMGSIGVIIQFVNLEKLYKWAKVERLTLSTGVLKDAGANHRPMTDFEKKYFQSLIDETLIQFKRDISQNRKAITAQVMEKYSDGRIFTGSRAVSLGFADEVGTLSDAISYVGEVSGLGKDPEVLFDKKRRPLEIMEWIDFDGGGGRESSSLRFVEDALKLKTLGYPLFILPSVLGY